MATCSTCQNSDYDPDNPCCPDSVPLVNHVLGKDRSCKTKRIEARRGILASASDKAGFLTGSASQPIAGMDFEQVLSSDGYVIIQTPNGRLYALKPDGGSEGTLLQLVWDGSVLKFVNIDFNNSSLADDAVSVTDTGFLAAWGCAGDGRIGLKKFVPGCEGSRYLVIDTEGNVTCDDRETDDCYGETVSDGLMDFIVGCSEGKIVKIAPEDGSILQYKLVEGVAKWSLEPFVQNETFVGGEFFLQRDFTLVSDLTFGPVNVNYPASVPSTAKWVQIRTNVYFLIQTTTGYGKFYFNGMPILQTLAASANDVHQGSSALYLPYGTGSFTLQGVHTPIVVGNTFADGGLAVGMVSYR
jgi:hypothetical protein